MYYVHSPDGIKSGHVPLRATGIKSGHGTVGWAPASPYEMPPPPPWPPDRRAPVIAVLDSGVKPHRWLPPQDGNPAFRVDAPWDPQDPIETLPPIHGEQNFGGFWGHATFLSGLIRLQAPDAQVLSVKVMSDAGQVSEENVISALNWLAGLAANRGAPDVVLMAFGRPKDAADDGTGGLKEAIDRLGSQGVKIVASAGNGASDAPTIPAYLAVDVGSPVVSVGSGSSAAVRDSFSNYGPWVTEWRPGADVLSIMPLRPMPAIDGDGYARWSGTSFSAASYAGELAQARAAQRAVDAGP